MPDADHETSRWPLRVYGVLALGVLSFTLAPILVRYARDAPGLAVAVWRTVIAAALLVPGVVLRSRDEIRQFTGRDVGLILASGVALGLHFIAWIESLYHTSVASSSVLVTTNPIFVAAMGYLILGERLSGRTVGAIGAAVGGAALIGWTDSGAVVEGGDAAWWGNSLALGAAVLVSVYLLIGRVVRQKVSWLAYVGPLYAVAACTAVAAAWLQDVPLFGYAPRVYLLCAALAVGPQLLGHGSFNYALQYVPAAIVGMLALLEPVGASILAYVLFAEVPPPASVVGMGVVLASVAVVVWVRRSEAGERDGGTNSASSAGV
jgi:drug/metabolite transporter (DMT)-like permease